MPKVKCEELSRDALLWATCRALGHSPVVTATGVAYRGDHGSWVYPRFTSDAEAGELMASNWIGVERPSKGQKTPAWRAIADSKVPEKFHESPVAHVVSAWGETLGVAVCRALVLSCIGETVDVPAELLNQTVRP